MEKAFADELKNYQKDLELTQSSMCEVLYGVPLRTYQSWLLGEKIPPIYYQKLIIHRLEVYNKVLDQTL
jgi:hypothetical protein